MEMDQIALTGIRCYGYTGALPEEQVLGQWFEVNLTLWADLQQAGQSDRLSDTLDYRSVIAQVQQLVSQSKFALLERLATAIAETVLDAHATTVPAVRQVRVHLIKLAAPIPNFSGQVAIDITRSRSNAALLSTGTQ
jgi:dihydroneopterin aldolase